MEPLQVALVKPEIHPNTGNIARLCAANRLPLYLVGTPGFRTDDRSVRRAGLDYWPFVDLRRAKNVEELRSLLPQSRFFYFSARALPALVPVGRQPRGIDGQCRQPIRFKEEEPCNQAPSSRPRFLQSCCLP